MQLRKPFTQLWNPRIQLCKPRKHTKPQDVHDVCKSYQEGREGEGRGREWKVGERSEGEPHTQSRAGTGREEREGRGEREAKEGAERVGTWRRG